MDTYIIAGVIKSGYNTPMNERTKKILLILLMAAGSAVFLYNGFALLFSQS